MQRTVDLQSVRVTVAVLVLSVFASAGQTSSQDKIQAPCSVESKSQYYRDFEASYEGDMRNQDVALKAAKNYLACPDGSDQQEIVAKLNLTAGRLLRAKNLNSEAIPYFIKSISYSSAIKTSPQTYADLAKAYEDGPYAKLSDDYKARFEGKDETLESLRALQDIYLVINCMIDAYARSVALAGVELPRQTKRSGLGRFTGSDPAEWADTLVGFYSFRHNGSEAGLQRLVETILSQPLPAWPIPVPEVPRRKE